MANGGMEAVGSSSHTVFAAGAEAMGAPAAPLREKLVGRGTDGLWVVTQE